MLFKVAKLTRKLQDGSTYLGALGAVERLGSPWLLSCSVLASLLSAHPVGSASRPYVESMDSISTDVYGINLLSQGSKVIAYK